MFKDLKHLSNIEIETLMQRYYNGETITNLLNEYHLSVRANELYKLFPLEILKNETCKYCKEPLVRNRLSKTDNKWKYNNFNIYCPLCHHKPYEQNCKCNNCIKEKQLLIEYRKQLIKKVYAQKTNPVNFYKLSFEQKVFLGTLCRALCKENLSEINPYIESHVILAPTNELCSQIYTSLSYNKIITVSPTSPIEAFVIDNDNFPNTYFTYKVTYYLNLEFPPNKQELFTEILNPTYYSSEYKDEALYLWRKIAIGECLEYLNYQLDKVGFEFTPGDKTYKIFDILLNDFSVSQIYGIIWKAIADASKLYLERNISKKHAANTVIGSCERFAERAKINGWNLTEYNRIKDLPQSTLSSFFFNQVLKIGDMGFKLPPTIV